MEQKDAEKRKSCPLTPEFLFQKCELYWPQPRTGRVREEDNDDKDGEQEDEGDERVFGRFVIKVKDSQEKDGFTVSDMEIQVQKHFCCHFFPNPYRSAHWSWFWSSASSFCLYLFILLDF